MVVPVNLLRYKLDIWFIHGFIPTVALPRESPCPVGRESSSVEADSALRRPLLTARASALYGFIVLSVSLTRLSANSLLSRALCTLSTESETAAMPACRLVARSLRLCNWCLSVSNTSESSRSSAVFLLSGTLSEGALARPFSVFVYFDAHDRRMAAWSHARMRQHSS